MTKERTIAALVLCAMVLAPWVAGGQEARDDKPHRHGAAAAGDHPGAKPSCEDMMEHRQAMHQRMQEMDAELDRLVSEMQAANGDAKVEATAAVVAELVEQRQAMHAMMMEHQPMMMQHMAGHAGEKGHGMSCPMMHPAPAPGEGKTEDPHSAHQPD